MKKSSVLFSAFAGAAISIFAYALGNGDAKEATDTPITEEDVLSEPTNTQEEEVAADTQ